MNLSTNPYVADPEWHSLIVWYFFLGGIAAGAYVMAALADLVGDAEQRRGVRVAYYHAFPLVNVCGLLLVADLGRPERFWHMLFQSQSGWPMFKWWSPMSVGSWGLTAFGLFSFASFAGVVAEDGRLGLGRFAALASRIRTGLTGRVFALGGALSAFFLASYTGVLLAATNQPIWSNTTWTGALFLTSSVSTGVAMIVLLDCRLKLNAPAAALKRLERLETWATALELTVMVAFLLSLGELALKTIQRWPGVLLPCFVVPVGLLLPAALKRVLGPKATELACVLVLLGGFALRAAVIGMPGPFLVSRDA
jgi:formate-dependent nitrite reductase membrane component NrfD